MIYVIVMLGICVSAAWVLLWLSWLGPTSNEVTKFSLGETVKRVVIPGGPMLWIIFVGLMGVEYIFKKGLFKWCR